MKNEIEIRKYNTNDYLNVLSLFRMNVPINFSAIEEKDLVHYLQNDSENYFVVCMNQNIIGCGGYNVFEIEKQVRISWDFFSPEYTGKGYGSHLLNFRISRIKKDFPEHSLLVRTSQHAYSFYAKYGFKVLKIEKDFWDKGFDLYLMQK